MAEEHPAVRVMYAPASWTAKHSTRIFHVFLPLSLSLSPSFSPYICTYCHICLLKYTYTVIHRYTYIPYTPHPYPISLPISLLSGAPCVFRANEHSYIYYNISVRRVRRKTSKHTPKKYQQPPTKERQRQPQKQTKNTKQPNKNKLLRTTIR